MAQLAIFHPPVINPVSIISPEFCAPHLIDLAIVRKVMTISSGNFVVRDIMGNIIFKVKGTLMSIQDRRVLLDASGNPIVTLQQKLMSAHDRWQVFRGESTESCDLIFTAKRSSVFQLKTKLDVFLANNREDVCDFKVKGGWLDRSCVVYAGDPDSSTIVAHVFSLHEKHFVFRGASTDTKDLLFTVERSSVIQLKTTLNVYLASNTKQDVCDFKIKGSWTEKSCVVYAGESNTIVAQMHKKTTVGSVLLNKDRFTVTVYPNIDYAFIVALIVILDDINGDDDTSEII
ncbi:hypothetical protein CISIN_1g023131mg [Citrus sinensis]|uniref:Protein LURP-one-related 15 n=1 Tax=Citrus sinensis TaxID=2711 RepID=A0A067FB00_CITSI|nr:hypothetical protein CISIN_1g023131mg [Citrus sinensis]